jgi:glycosyltransferase involved in cell wall biosynthesis
MMTIPEGGGATPPPVRVLVATHLVPYPPDTGGKVVSAQTLACLRRLGPLDVCAFDPPWRRVDGTPDLRTACDRASVEKLVRRPASWWPVEALRGRPYYVFRDASPAMGRQVATWADDGADVLIADSLHMAHYVSGLRRPKVLVEHNVESYLLGEYVRRDRNPLVRLVGGIEQRLLERHEREQCNRFDAVIALSDDDRQRLRQLGVETQIVVLPPAVEPVEPVPDGPDRRHIVHVGTGHWPPIAEGLRWYLRAVHPLVAAGGAGAELRLAGSPPPFLARGAPPPRVKVLGYVADLEQVYRAAAVFIVPLFVGGGVRLKILHALARGLAVVSTTAGCEGLGLEDGTHVLVADAPEQFSRAILAVLSDRDLRQRLGAAGRAHVRARFQPEARCAALHALLREVAKRAGPVPA